jgi:hypothetical protein
MATEGQDTSVSGADMFDAAFEQPQTQAQPEPQQEAQQQPAQEQAEPKADATGRLHGADGKFASKTPQAQQEPPAQAQQPPTPTQPQAQQQQDHRVPLMELLNEREKRQQYERERDQFRQQFEALQRQVAAAQSQQQQPEAPDVFENPQGFAGHLQQQLTQQLRNQEVNFSLRLAHREHKQEFEQAYEAAIRARQLGDPAVATIYNSSDPGEALMRWHRSNSLLEKTGGNLDAYLEAQLQAKLKDPAFLAKAIEAARGQAQQQPNSQQAPVVELPPSLTRTPGSSAAQASNGMPSGQELFDSAFAR